MVEMSHRPAGVGQIFYTAPDASTLIKNRARYIVENNRNGNVKPSTYCQLMCAIYNTFCWGSTKMSGCCPFCMSEAGCVMQPLQYCK